MVYAAAEVMWHVYRYIPNKIGPCKKAACVLPEPSEHKQPLAGTCVQCCCYRKLPITLTVTLD